MTTFKEIEEKLSKNTNSPFLQGDNASKLDHEAYEAVKKSGAPKPGDYPNAYGWFCLLNKFQESVRQSWGAPGANSAAAAPQGKGQAASAAAPKGKGEAPAQGADIEAANASVTEQGNIVKALKEKKKAGEATKEEVDAAVAELLSRKKKVAAMGGEVPAAPQQSKKDKKDDKAAGGKNAKQAVKDARLASRQAQTQAKDTYVKDPNDSCADKFGDLPLNRSQGDPELRFTKTFTNVSAIDLSLVDKVVIIRARVHNSRAKGKMCFMVLRQQTATVQAGLFVDDNTSKGMVTYSSKIPKESIVEVKAKVIKAEKDVDSCTQSKVELQVQEIWTVDKSAPMLPFQIEDASRLVTNQQDEAGEGEGIKDDGKVKAAVVKQDVRLNNRIIDLRVPTNHAIMRLQAAVSQLFREFMYENDFTEIHSPKLIGGASEGGSNVFTLKYFDQPACLAQSPQLYKQMALCADMERVFEIGPVFRAENSNTNRHLCEFTGLDMEMVIKEHYFEVLDMLAGMFCYIFENLDKRFKKELNTVKEQYPFEDFKCKTPVVKIHFKDGVKMLHAAGVEQGALDDLSTESEKALGKLVKEKYDTDFYMLYGYPAAIRPFYTMLDPTDSNYTNSYDFFMRGEEIVSGAQRIHEPEMLVERAKFWEIPVETLSDYINAFKYGAPAHGGCGVGLERVVKFYCNLWNIRKASLFPRDPKRIKP